METAPLRTVLAQARTREEVRSVGHAVTQIVYDNGNFRGVKLDELPKPIAQEGEPTDVPAWKLRFRAWLGTLPTAAKEFLLDQPILK